jgi:hypothetical protein
VATPIVAAEDVDAEDAGLPHLAEGDFLLAGHARNSAKNRPQSELAI